MEGMRLSKTVDESRGSKDLETFMNEVVTKENEVWLFQQINTRVENICINCRRLQRTALARLQTFFKETPGELEGTRIYALVKKYPTASPEQQPQLITQISREIHEYAKLLFKKQGVPLLNDV